MIIVSTHTPKLSESIPLVMRPALARGSYWGRVVTADAAADDASGNLRIGLNFLAIPYRRNATQLPPLVSQNVGTFRWQLRRRAMSPVGPKRTRRAGTAAAAFGGKADTAPISVHRCMSGTLVARLG